MNELITSAMKPVDGVCEVAEAIIILCLHESKGC